MTTVYTVGKGQGVTLSPSNTTTTFVCKSALSVETVPARTNPLFLSEFRVAQSVVFPAVPSSKEQQLQTEVERLTKLVNSMQQRELDQAFAAAGLSQFVDPAEQALEPVVKRPIPLRALRHRTQRIGLYVPFNDD